MKEHLKKAFTFAVVLVFLSGVAYSQTAETGAIIGMVKDTEDNPLPGVEITADSPNMIGGTRSQITSAEGRFRFALLQPGVYSIEVRLEGFTPQRREEVRVSVRQTLTIDFILEIGTLSEEVIVVAQSPLIDVKDSEMATVTLDSEALQNLVYDREAYIYKVIELAPGTTPVYHGSSAYGGEGRAGNSYYMDGIEISVPVWGSSWHIPDAQGFEEVKVTGLGASAEYDGFSGVQMNMVGKSGGNSFDGMLQMTYQGYDWVAANFDPAEYSLWSEPQEHMFQEARFGIGGPVIRDKLWLYANVKWLSEGFKTGAGNKYHKDQPKHFAKLTFQAGSSTRITGVQSFDDWIYDYRYTSVYRPKEASSYEYCHTYVHSFTVFQSLSDRTYFEVKVGRVADYSDYGGYAGADVPGRQDDLTGKYSGNYKWFEEWPDWRYSAVAHLSHHADEFLNGSHDFKFGVEYEQIGNQELVRYNGTYFYVDNVSVGDELYNYAYKYSYDRRPVGTRMSVFVQDSWKMGNITINPGIRYNAWRGYLTSLDATPLKTSGIAPRIGITWDVFGDHTTAVKVHYGKYYDKLTTNKFAQASVGTNDWVQYLVNPDGSKTEIYREGYNANPTTVDPDIKFQHMNQFSMGIERELMKDISVSASFVWKKRENYISRINYGATYALKSFTYTDENGAVQTGQAYDKLGTTPDKYMLTNPVEGTYSSVIRTPWRTYIGGFFSFEKRFSNKWMLAANYAFAKSKDTYTGRDPQMNPNSQLRVLWNGEPVSYPVHNFKVYGTVILPLNIYFSPMFTYRTGPRWTKQIYAPVTGSPDYNIEKPLSNKLDDVYIFDVRIEKNFNIKGDLRVGLMIDLYNAFNLAREEDIENNITRATYGEITDFNFGRMYKIGFRVYF